MKIANNYQELCIQTAQWFLQGFNTYVQQGLYDFEDSKKVIKKEVEKLIKWMIKVRYLQYPDEHCENWLNKYSSFDYGVLGFILDVVYIESLDETISNELGTLREIQKKLPSTFEALIGSSMFEVVNLFEEIAIPQVITFGDIFYNKTFKNKQGSEAISYVAKKYSETF